MPGSARISASNSPSKIAAALAAQAVMAQDDIKNRVVALGYTLIAGGPDAVRERIAKNVPFLKELIANAKIPQHACCPPRICLFTRCRDACPSPHGARAADGATAQRRYSHAASGR